MSTFTTTERAKIRSYLGYAAVNQRFDPSLETAMDSVEQIVDSDATITLIKSYVTKIDSILTKIEAHYDCLEAGGAGNVRIDAARAISVLESQGRRLVHMLAAALGHYPARDIFAPSEMLPGSPAFGGVNPRLGGWGRP